MGKTIEEIYREYNDDLANAYRKLAEDIEKASPERVKELEDKLAELETLNKSLTSDNESINILYNTTQSENEQLKLKVAELEKKYDDINIVCKGIQGELDKTKFENETLKKDKERLENENIACKKGYDDTLAAYTLLQTEFSNLKKAYDEQTEKAEKFDSLKKAYDDNLEGLQNAVNDVITLKKAGDQLRNQLEATAKFIPYLMDEVVETVAKNAPELATQLDAFKLFIRQNQVLLSERANAKMN